MIDMVDGKSDLQPGHYDIGTTSIRLIRTGNMVQTLFSSPLEAKYLNRNWRKGMNEKPTKRKKAELELIAELAMVPTLAAEAKLSKLAASRNPTTRILKGIFVSNQYL